MRNPPGIVDTNGQRLFLSTSRAAKVLPFTKICIPAGSECNYGYWVKRFGSSFDLLGKTVRINRLPFTVIGIAPPHFSGEVVGSPTDIWIPLSTQPQVNLGDSRLDKRDTNYLLCMGRLHSGSARLAWTALNGTIL